MDIVTDKRFLSRIIGKTIKITTTYGFFKGLLLSIHADCSFLLVKVKDLRTGIALPGAKSFYGHSIIKVDDEDVNYSVIDQFQSLFGFSMQHLQRQKVLSLTAVGQSLSRYGKLCWIQVATNSCVYLFDILILGPRVFKNGLQMILEDKGILKVVHDCRWLADLLSHQYGVILSNVFDTQVADVYLFSMETGGFLPHRTCTLKECVTRYLNVTPSRVSILTYKQILEKDNPNVWFVRPMPIPLFKVVALETIYLLPLRLVMLDAMFADFTFLVDEYLDTYRKRRADYLGSVEIASSELPKELQQLPFLQQLRREKALQEFHFTSQGFLSREKIKKAK